MSCLSARFIVALQPMGLYLSLVVALVNLYNSLPSHRVQQTSDQWPQRPWIIQSEDGRRRRWMSSVSVCWSPISQVSWTRTFLAAALIHSRKRQFFSYQPVICLWPNNKEGTCLRKHHQIVGIDSADTDWAVVWVKIWLSSYWFYSFVCIVVHTHVRPTSLCQASVLTMIMTMMMI